LVDLEESDVGDCVNNLDVVLDLFERSVENLSLRDLFIKERSNTAT
jgi:hypothetical protein